MARPDQLFDLIARMTETPLASGIAFKGLIESLFIEVRPKQGGKVELGVGKLPQQKIRDALLTAGADEQIGVGRTSHAQIRRQAVGIELLHQPWCAAGNPVFVQHRHGKRNPAARAYGRQRIGHVLRRPRARRILDGLTGLVFLGFGAKIAFEHRT